MRKAEIILWLVRQTNKSVHGDSSLSARKKRHLLFLSCIFLNSSAFHFAYQALFHSHVGFFPSSWHNSVVKLRVMFSAGVSPSIALILPHTKASIPVTLRQNDQQVAQEKLCFSAGTI